MKSGKEAKYGIFIFKMIYLVFTKSKSIKLGNIHPGFREVKATHFLQFFGRLLRDACITYITMLLHDNQGIKLAFFFRVLLFPNHEGPLEHHRLLSGQ